MTVLPRPRLRADEFLAWAAAQPERYELVAGEVVAMSPERLGHARVKLAVCNALAAGIKAAGLSCEAMIDGVAVEIDESTVYEPDALVRCGPPLPDDALRITDPVVVVEVLSPSSRARDTGAKLEDYFRLPSLRHYLILKTENRTVIHHARDDTGGIHTRILREGALELSPPGLIVAIARLFV
jgi:Uma2 family endonuclease